MYPSAGCTHSAKNMTNKRIKKSAKKAIQAVVFLPSISIVKGKSSFSQIKPIRKSCLLLSCILTNALSRVFSAAFDNLPLAFSSDAHRSKKSVHSLLPFLQNCCVSISKANPKFENRGIYLLMIGMQASFLICLYHKS